MNVLSKVIRNRHFVWCSVERTLARHDCKQCKGTMYLFAMFLAGITAFLEFWGSSKTGSLSLGSDAWHVVFDGLGYFIGVVDAFLITKFFTDRVIARRVKRLMEITIALFVILTAVFILDESFDRMRTRNIPEMSNNTLLFSVALFGLATNIFLLRVFKLFAVDHCGGINHSHQDDKILSANIWHTLGDAVSSLLVIVNSIVFSFTSQPEWHYLDLVASAVIASFLLYQGIRTIRQ